MGQYAKYIILIGCVLVCVGSILLLISQGKIPWLGKLPGDILIRNKHGIFYFPLATCLLISIVASLILYFFAKK